MQEALTQRAKILIVEDDEANARLLDYILREAGYAHRTSTMDPRQAVPLFMEVQPDIVLLDLHMPHLDGFAVMQQLRARIPEDTYLPILVLSGDFTTKAKHRALALGAKDFLNKPPDATEVALRVHNLLATRFLHLGLEEQNRTLEQQVRARTEQLEAAHVESLERLALAAEYRHDETGEHTRRVGDTAGRIAQALGLPQGQCDLIRRAAPLHDVGKIGIPDAILLKPSKLTPEEFEVMKTHTTLGVKILLGSRSPLLQLAEEVALTHHERWDGTGYAGLKGSAIPLTGRIVAAADVFDALTHARPYKPAWPVADAVAEVTRQRGRQFDPQVVDALLGVIQQAP